MKPLLQMTGGVLATVVGTVGVVLSLFIGVQIRQSTETLNREIPQSLGHAVEIAQSVRQQGEATSKILQTTRERVVYLGGTIEQLSQKLGRRDKETSVVLAIDEDIDRQLDNAKQFVHSMQNSMRNLGSTLLLFDSVSIFGSQSLDRIRGKAVEQEDNPLRHVAVGLRETADLLDQVTHAIVKLQSGQSISPQQLINIQTTLERVDRELVKIKTEVNNFSEEVAVTEFKFKKLQQDTPALVQYVSNLITLFLVCFGSSQLMLAFFGLNFANQSRIQRKQSRRAADPTP